jgi:KTSC domain
MSQRSIIEINHDHCGLMLEHTSPEDFAELLRRALASGSDESWEPLESLGIERIVQVHHSVGRRVILSDSGWIDCIVIAEGSRQVMSSNIARAHYDKDERIFTAIFHNGAKWEWLDVPYETALGFFDAPSQGKYFIAEIQGKFEERKVE